MSLRPRCGHSCRGPGGPFPPLPIPLGGLCALETPWKSSGSQRLQDLGYIPSRTSVVILRSASIEWKGKEPCLARCDPATRGPIPAFHHLPLPRAHTPSVLKKRALQRGRGFIELGPLLTSLWPPAGGGDAPPQPGLPQPPQVDDAWGPGRWVSPSVSIHCLAERRCARPPRQPLRLTCRLLACGPWTRVPVLPCGLHDPGLALGLQ